YPKLLKSITTTEVVNFSSEASKTNAVEGSGNNVYAQNFYLNGDYYITAVVNGKESNFSMVSNTYDWNEQLPASISDSVYRSSQKFATVADLPKDMEVQFIDQSKSRRAVVYDTQKITGNKNGGQVTVPFKLQGTALTGTVNVLNYKGTDDTVLAKQNDDVSTTGNVLPENKVVDVPPPTVPTIIDTDKDNKPQKENVVENQKENTKEEVKEGNAEKLPILNDIKVNADSAFEEYLALKMINGDRNISLKGFPEAQNSTVLEDTLLKVYYQNPLILGLKSYRYDYSNLILEITYEMPASEMKQQQTEIKKEALKITKSIMKSGMSDEEKRQAIYLYFEKNTKYDVDALKNAEKNNFRKVDDRFRDSFTTYGIMVKKVGVCASYAASFQMIADIVGLESVVVTGRMTSVPHAWNKVKIGNEWLHLDATNNETNSGIPFYIYEVSDRVAIQQGFNQDVDFALDKEVKKFAGVSNQYDYYYRNNLVVKTAGDIESVVTKQLKAGQQLIVFRLDGDIENKVMMQTLATTIKTHAPEKLNAAKVGKLGTCMIVYFEN
ncbi:MAG: transglutaminase domain-containing protein, partial [Bacilli bacterium]